MRPRTILLSALAVLASATPTAFADAPTRPREFTCSDGTVFIGEQVRFGAGRPPHIWHVVSGVDAVSFNFHAASVTAPDGTVLENVTWDNTAGVERSKDLITCSFIIPIGPLAGSLADFVGYFVPTGHPGQ